MNDGVKELFECREKVKATLEAHGLDPTQHHELVTDLVLLVMNWPLSRG